MHGKVDSSALAKSLLIGIGITTLLLIAEIMLKTTSPDTSLELSCLLRTVNIAATGVVGVIYGMFVRHGHEAKSEDNLALGSGLAGLGTLTGQMLLSTIYNLITRQLFESTMITMVGWGFFGALYDLAFRTICVGAQLIAAFLLGMVGSVLSIWINRVLRLKNQLNPPVHPKSSKATKDNQTD